MNKFSEPTLSDVGGAEHAYFILGFILYEI